MAEENEGGCPMRIRPPAEGGSNRDWWPDQINLKMLIKYPAEKVGDVHAAAEKITRLPINHNDSLAAEKHIVRTIIAVRIGFRHRARRVPGGVRFDELFANLHHFWFESMMIRFLEMNP